MGAASSTGRSVLLFCSRFFGYEKRIEDALSDIGMDVCMYDERPSSGFIGKACVRLNIAPYRPVVRRYYQSILNRHKGDRFDYVLVINGEAISEDILDMLRLAYPRAEFILYLWDSVRNIPDCEKRMGRYDRVLTFDPADAKTYGIPFLSVPYGKEHTRTYANDHYDFDAAFIGTAHSIRPRVVTQIRRQCEALGRTCFTYFYSPHILVYFFYKLTNPDYRYISLRDIHFKPLPISAVCDIYSRSKCVLDIEHTGQRGSTPRTVEMLPMKRKIITTNALIREYDFFNGQNFCIIDRADPRIDPDFFDKPFIPVPDSVLHRYSPAHFARSLFQFPEESCL